MKKLLHFFRSRDAVSFIKTSISVFLLLITVKAQAWQGNGSMACNDNVQVSLDYNCEADITPDMILEGSNYPPSNVFTVRISNVTGTIVTKPGFHTVTVTNTLNNNSCWGTISVEDKLPPLIDNCPCAQGNNDPACQFYCTDLEGILNGTISVPVPLVYENCTSYTTSKTDQVLEGGCGERIIKRSYLFTDAYGNKSLPCISYFYLDPVSLANVTGPVVQVQLTCDADPSPEAIFTFYKLTLSAAEAIKYAYPHIDGRPIKPGPGGSCNVLSTYTDSEIYPCGLACSNSKKYLRNWIVLDWCTGEVRNYIQTIKATDNQPPTVVAADLTVSTDPWGCYANIEFPPPTLLHDNCSSTVTYTVVGGPVGTQIIYDPVDKTYTALNVPKGVHTFYYKATDCCGNIGTDPVFVTIVDKSAPIAISKQNVVVSLTTSGNAQGIAKVYTNSIDNGSHDGCTAVKLEIRRDQDACGIVGNATYNNDGHSFDNINDPDNGAYVKFCCADLTGIENGVPFGIVTVWLRVWDDGDMDGIFGSAGDNYNETWSYVRVEDKLPPSIFCPPDITIRCDDDYLNVSLTGRATGGHTCNLDDVEYTDITQLNPCGAGTVLRRWWVKGSPNTFCLQRITIRPGDEFNPNTIIYPSNVTTDCKHLGTEYKPTWIAPPCSLIGYSIDSDTFKFEDGACFKIINTYTVVDWCRYDPNSSNPVGIWTGIQIIKVLDDTPPVITCQDLMFEVNDNNDLDADGNKCELKGLKLSNTASDNGDCASKWLKWVILVDLWGDGVADYEFSSYLPANDNTFNDSNLNGIKDKYISPTSSGEMAMIQIPEDIGGSMANHKVSWKVSDGCGNVAACTQIFMVVDKKKPTPYCISLSTALMQNGQIELWARDFDLNSYDNCTDQEDLLFTFDEFHPVLSKLNVEHYFKGLGLNATASEYADGLAQKWGPLSKSSAKIFNCEDLPKADVRMTVWDEKGNYDYCEVELTLVDNQDACGPGTKMNISGRVASESGTPVSDVKVGLKNVSIPALVEKSTTATGSFEFKNVIPHFDYQLVPYIENSYLNGVSTLDLVLIQRHILNATKLNSPYKLIAADVNNDEKISIGDLVELRKLIIGTIPKLSNNQSWRFVNSKSQFTNQERPWPFIETVNIHDLSINMNEDFTACKVGDVNNTATTQLTGDISDEKRSVNTEAITIQDITMETGMTYDISLETKALLAGYQLGLSANGMEFIAAHGNKFTESNYSINSNKISISWNDNIPATGDLMYLEVKATSPGKLSEKLGLTELGLTPEAYLAAELEVRNIKLQFATKADEKYEYALFQNEPNPFTGKTKISFTLPSNGEASLSIHDINGRLVYKNSAQFEKGLNTIEINSSELGASGLLYYILESGTFSETKKMIDLK